MSSERHAPPHAGAGDRRLDLGAVRRKAPSDARRDQRRDRRYAVHDHASLRPRVAQSQRGARAWLGKGAAEALRRFRRARREWPTHRACPCPPRAREPGVRMAAGAAPFAGRAGHFDAPFHARAQPARRDERDRCRRRRPELPRKLRRDREACRRSPAHAAHRLPAFRPDARQGARELQVWSKLVSIGQGDDYYRMVGAGEYLLYAAGDPANSPRTG